MPLWVYKSVYFTYRLTQLKETLLVTHSSGCGQKWHCLDVHGGPDLGVKPVVSDYRVLFSGCTQHQDVDYVCMMFREATGFNLGEHLERDLNRPTKRWDYIIHLKTENESCGSQHIVSRSQQI
jgi:hypothetical protein